LADSVILTPMRRYPMVFILLLSFVLPLQAVADILLSNLICPMMLATESTTLNAAQTQHQTHNQARNQKTASTKMPHDMAAMDKIPSQVKLHGDKKMPRMKCCPETNSVQANNSTHQNANQSADQDTDSNAPVNHNCPQMKCCHLCKTSIQAFIYIAPDFIAPRTMTLVPNMNSPFFASINPNAVWRPPITA